MKDSAAFLLTLLHATTNTHLLHWTTKSYAQHTALGTFYEELPGLVDELAESIMGKFDETLKFPDDYYRPAGTGKDELQALSEYVQEARLSLPQDSEIQNLVDEIADLINKTLFLLRFP